MELRDFIYVKDAVIPLNALSSLLKWMNKKSDLFQDAAVISQNSDLLVDTSIRKVKNFSLNPNSKSKTEIHWFNFLKKSFAELCGEYQNKYKVDMSLVGLNEITILKYENYGHYKFHTDHHASAPRTMTIVYLLNNDYEGGNLVFGDHTSTKEILTIERVPNRAIIWPSNFLFPHKVIPITKGVRYSIVSWAL
jgi:hypothetical protein